MRQDREYSITLRVYSSRTAGALRRALTGKSLAVDLGIPYRNLPNGTAIRLHPAIVDEVTPLRSMMTAQDAVAIACALGASEIRVHEQHGTRSSSSVPASYSFDKGRVK